MIFQLPHKLSQISKRVYRRYTVKHHRRLSSKYIYSYPFGIFLNSVSVMNSFFFHTDFKGILNWFKCMLIFLTIWFLYDWQCFSNGFRLAFCKVREFNLLYPSTCVEYKTHNTIIKIDAWFRIFNHFRNFYTIWTYHPYCIFISSLCSHWMWYRNSKCSIQYVCIK